MGKGLLFSSNRGMRHLACRFCGATEALHVVDPLLDLRYRFEDKNRLSNMLKARGRVVDVNKVEAKYLRWWKAYENVCSSICKETPDPALKKALVFEAEGLLGALELPNDIEESLQTHRPVQKIRRNRDHVSFLRKSGMLNINSYPFFIDMVGLPTSISYSLQQNFIDRVSRIAVFVSPPHVVRGAVIDGVNMPLEHFPAFTDGSETGFPLFLTGHSLPSLVSLLVKKVVLPQSNKWPFRIFSSGTAYKNFNVNSDEGRRCTSALDLFNVPQRMKLSLLSLCSSREQELEEFVYLKQYFKEISSAELAYDFSVSDLPVEKLQNFESVSTALLYDDKPMARVSLSGSYVPRRLNIQCDGGQFVYLLAAEVDITSCVGMIIEEYLMGESSVPEVIRKLL